MILENKADITQALLKEYLHYDASNGNLTWIKKLGRKVLVGNRAGTQVKGRDNRIIKIFGHVYIEHRVIWLWVYGYMPQVHEHIDHINHCESDNRIANLRLVTQAENNKNNSLRSDSSTGIVGIWINKLNRKKKYMAELSVGKTRLLKSFYSLEEAVAQRQVWEAQHGFHSNHGNVKIV